ncbi:nicotinate-nucleotide adenylyltransferase [soil metagenome]
MPTGEAPHRVIEPEPGPEVRLRLAAAACEQGEPVEVSPLEVESDGPSFTYRTLEMLSESRASDELTFLMGADVAASLEGWRQPERVVELARIGVAARPGTDTTEAARVLDGLGANWELVRMPEIGVSSTEVRERIAEGRPIRHLVPAGAREMIENEGLYR